MNVTVLGYKGGTGKSTSALHLACALAERGTTALFDGDPNRSVLGWAERGGDGALPFKVYPVTMAPKVAREVEHMVFDTEARPDTNDVKEAAELSDWLVIPTTPDAMTLQATYELVQHLRTIGVAHFRVMLTVVPPAPSRAGDEAADFLTGAGVPLLSSRIPRLAVFQHAAAAGLPVSRLKDRSAAGAWSAYQHAAAEVFGG